MSFQCYIFHLNYFCDYDCTEEPITLDEEEEEEAGAEYDGEGAEADPTNPEE